MGDSTVPAKPVEYAWLTRPELVGTITEMFVAHVTPDYVSHGDMMEGRAEGPGRWYPDLAQVARQEWDSVDFEDGAFTSPGYRIALAWRGNDIVGFAAVAHVEHDAGRADLVRYGRIDDIVVAPTARGLGVGSGLMAWVEQALLSVGVTRVFLESGINNTRAHALFHRRGYTTTSVTMVKDLRPEGSSPDSVSS